MQRRLFLSALGAATLTLVAGCGGGGGNDNTATIVPGIVLDSEQNDLPVEGATVVIGGASAISTTRDKANAQNQVGSFKVVGATQGATTATIRQTGKPDQQVAFVPSVTTGTNPSLTLYINIGQVRGRVIDETGKPVKNAFVVVNTPIRSVTAFTLADGTFLADLVPDGVAEVSAGAGPKLATKTVTVGKSLVDIGDLTLLADSNATPPATLRTISGTVTLGTTSTPGAGATVVLFRDGIQIETTTASATGAYYFAMPAGNYSVRALATGYVDGNAPAALANPNNPITVDLNLTLR